MELEKLIDINALYSKVVTFFESESNEDLIVVPIVFPIQTIRINIKIIKKENVIETFRYAVSLVKLYRNHLIRITYNGVNSQSYITDRSTAAGFIEMFDRQNKVIYDLLLLDVSDV